MIATVLLLAFTVAIGTMIVSYLIDTTHNDVCSKVRITIESGAHACYASGHVSFIMSNKGDKALTGALVRLVNANADIIEHQVALSVAVASATKIDVTYQGIVNAKSMLVVTVIPKILADGKEKPCVDNTLEAPVVIC